MPGFGKLVAAGVLSGAFSVAGMAQSSAATPCYATMTPGCPNLVIEAPNRPPTTASPQSSLVQEGQSPSAAQSAVTPSTAQPATEPAAPVTPKTLEIPAGTKVLLTIRSAINTKTAQAGDGVYLQSSFPVIANGRAVIPAGVYVQGVVDSVERHIRIKGPAKLTMHFTSIIFPNGSVVEIPGMVNSLPGSDGPKVNGERDGTAERQRGPGGDRGGQRRGDRRGGWSDWRRREWRSG